MTQGIVREIETPDLYKDAPIWMRHVMNNAQAYGDFYTDLTKGIQRCESQISDFLVKDLQGEAKIMLGKREALMEMRFMLDAYRREEAVDGG